MHLLVGKGILMTPVLVYAAPGALWTCLLCKCEDREAAGEPMAGEEAAHSLGDGGSP